MELLYPVRMRTFFGMGPEITLSKKDCDVLIKILIVSNAALVFLNLTFLSLGSCKAAQVVTYIFLSSNAIAIVVLSSLILSLAKPLWPPISYLCAMFLYHLKKDLKRDFFRSR